MSDSYDPEFGTGERADMVRRACREMSDRLSLVLGAPLRDIVEVAEDVNSTVLPAMCFTERELRIMRFALNRAIDTI